MVRRCYGRVCLCVKRTHLLVSLYYLATDDYSVFQVKSMCFSYSAVIVCWFRASAIRYPLWGRRSPRELHPLVSALIIASRRPNVHLLPATPAVRIIITPHAPDGRVLKTDHTPRLLVLVCVLVGLKPFDRRGAGIMLLGAKSRRRGQTKGIEGAEAPKRSHAGRDVVLKVVLLGWA